MKKILKILNLLLLLVSLFIAYNIFVKKDTDFSFLKNLYSTMTNHINISKQEQSVSSTNKFIKVSQYKYTNENYSVYCPFNGTVIEQNDSTILIKCDNGYYAYFSSLINVAVRKYDVISPNDVIANFIDNFNFYFVKDEKIYSYEEIIAFN